jgi:hypothetical protein
MQVVVNYRSRDEADSLVASIRSAGGHAMAAQADVRRGPHPQTARRPDGPGPRASQPPSPAHDPRRAPPRCPVRQRPHPQPHPRPRPVSSTNAMSHRTSPPTAATTRPSRPRRSRAWHRNSVCQRCPTRPTSTAPSRPRSPRRSRRRTPSPTVMRTELDSRRAVTIAPEPVHGNS